MSDARTPTYDQLSALCAQMAAALQFYQDGWRFKMLKGRPGLEWHPKEALLDDCGNTAKAALTAYRTLSPDPVYAEAKNMFALLSSIDIVRGADPTEIANTLNRARGKV